MTSSYYQLIRGHAYDAYPLFFLLGPAAALFRFKGRRA